VKCPHCHGELEFELQLADDEDSTPPAIKSLSDDSRSHGAWIKGLDARLHAVEQKTTKHDERLDRLDSITAVGKPADSDPN